MEICSSIARGSAGWVPQDMTSQVGSQRKRRKRRTFLPPLLSSPQEMAFVSVTGVKTFLSHHYYEGTVSFLPVTDNVASPRDKLICRSG